MSWTGSVLHLWTTNDVLCTILHQLGMFWFARTDGLCVQQEASQTGSRLAKHCSLIKASRCGAKSADRPLCDHNLIWMHSLLWEIQSGFRDWFEEILQVDMVDGSHVQHITQQLRKINEIAAIHETSRCRIDLGLILNRFTVLDGLCSAREQASDRAKSRAEFSDRDHLKSSDSFSDGSHSHSHAHKPEHSHTHDQQIGTVRLALPGLLDLERCPDW